MKTIINWIRKRLPPAWGGPVIVVAHRFLVVIVDGGGVPIEMKIAVIADNEELARRYLAAKWPDIKAAFLLSSEAFECQRVTLRPPPLPPRKESISKVGPT